MVRTRRAVGIVLALAVPLFLLALLSRPSPAATAEQPFRYPEGRSGSGELKYRHGLPVLTVAGTPEEMGTAVGALGLKPGRRMLGYPRELLDVNGAGKLYGSFLAVGRDMVKRFPADYRTEMDAMVRSAGVDRDAVIVGNTLFDVKKIFACSALLVEAERSSTGGPLMGRNLDYPSLGYAHQYTLVTVYRPKGKHAFVSVGFPGLVGCLSGMNDAGLSVAVLEVFQAKDGETTFDVEGLPYALCYRKLLEECGTIDEAAKLLRSLPRVAMTNLVVADRDGVAVFEVSPRRVEVRRAASGILPCTNHYVTPPLAPKEQVDVCVTLERYDSLSKALDGRSRLSPEDLRHDLERASLGDLTLQTMVFEPRTLKLHLAVGELPAAKGPFHTLELGPLFRGE